MVSSDPADRCWWIVFRKYFSKLLFLYTWRRNITDVHFRLCDHFLLRVICERRRYCSRIFWGTACDSICYDRNSYIVPKTEYVFRPKLQKAFFSETVNISENSVPTILIDLKLLDSVVHARTKSKSAKGSCFYRPTTTNLKVPRNGVIGMRGREQRT